MHIEHASFADFATSEIPMFCLRTEVEFYSLKKALSTPVRHWFVINKSRILSHVLKGRFTTMLVKVGFWPKRSEVSRPLFSIIK